MSLSMSSRMAISSRMSRRTRTSFAMARAERTATRTNQAGSKSCANAASLPAIDAATPGDAGVLEVWLIGDASGQHRPLHWSAWRPPRPGRHRVHRTAGNVAPLLFSFMSLWGGNDFSRNRGFARALDRACSMLFGAYAVPPPDQAGSGRSTSGATPSTASSPRVSAPSRRSTRPSPGSSRSWRSDGTQRGSSLYPLAIWGEAQLFCAFCPRGSPQRTLWDGNGRSGGRIASPLLPFIRSFLVAAWLACCTGGALTSTVSDRQLWNVGYTPISRSTDRPSSQAQPAGREQEQIEGIAMRPAVLLLPLTKSGSGLSQLDYRSTR